MGDKGRLDSTVLSVQGEELAQRDDQQRSAISRRGHGVKSSATEQEPAVLEIALTSSHLLIQLPQYAKGFSYFILLQRQL